MKTKSVRYMLVLVGSLVLLNFFQNCSAPVRFTPAEVLDQSLSIEVKPNYHESNVGDQENFPPIKLFVIMDNSATMLANQMNLQNSFSKLFDGDNASNLSHLDTTVYMFNTSQLSVDRSASVFPRLPNMSLDDIRNANVNDLLGKRNPYIDGSIPGDLVGYQVTDKDLEQSGYKQLSYLPMPVLGLVNNNAGGTNLSFGIHKGPNDSVDNLKAEWNNRIALLNPNLSKIDSSNNQGYLDEVVNKESGLCALSRVLRHNDKFVKPGDMAAFIIVSDENDSDPTGANCIDSFTDTPSGVDLYDGHCDQSFTNIHYQEKILNPSKQRCEIAYNSGFSYRYNYNQPMTNVTYYKVSQAYDLPQTAVSYNLRNYQYDTPSINVTYWTNTQSYEIPQTEVTYYTKHTEYEIPNTNISYFLSHQEYDVLYTNISYYTSYQTYEIPTTKYSYFTKVVTCQHRDGADVNCVTTYPKTERTKIEGNYNSLGCQAFINSKESGVTIFTDADHAISCAMDTPNPKVGACSITNSSIQNCKTNYSTLKNLANPIIGNYQTAGCAAFATADKFPVGEAVVFGDATHPINCSAATPVHMTTGSCTTTDTNKANCTTVYDPKNTTTPIAGTYLPDCNTFAANKISGIVKNDASHPIVCSAATTTKKSATCVVGSTSDPNIVNCHDVYVGPLVLSPLLDGAPGTNSCQTFANAKLPSGYIKDNTSYPVACTPKPNKPTTGACTPGADANKLNCKDNFVGPTPKNGLKGDIASASTATSCLAFAQTAKILPTNYVQNDSAHPVSCAAGTTTTSPVVSACPTNDLVIKNCRPVYTSKTGILFTGDYLKTSCNAFVGTLGLPSNLVSSTNVLANENDKLPSCSTGPIKPDNVGACTVSDPTKLNCHNVYKPDTLTGLTGDFNTVGCAAFVNGKMPSDAALNDSGHPINCINAASVASYVDGSEVYNSTNWLTYNPALNSDCSPELVSTISISKSLPAPTSCKITAVPNSNGSLENVQCNATNVADFCSSSQGTRRNCVGTSVPAGAPYATNYTDFKAKGMVTCQTQCSQTEFCKTLPGTVADNYHNCDNDKTVALPNEAVSSFTGKLATEVNTCAPGLLKVVTNGPYQSKGVRVDYVAGAASAARSENALAQYIKSRSHDLLSDNLSITSIFTLLQNKNGTPGNDDPLGAAQSYGTEYVKLADLVNGDKHSALEADYSSSLQKLSGIITNNLSRSFSIAEAKPNQKVYRVWFKAAGDSDWGQPLSQDLWTSAGGTVSINSGFKFKMGDKFKFEYY